MLWPNLGLAALIVALLLTLGLSGSRQAWPYARVVVSLALQLAGVMAVTWLLVRAIPVVDTVGAATTAAEPAPTTFDQLVSLIARPALNSLELLALAAAWGLTAGSAIAVSTVASRRRNWLLLPLSALVWAVPTFLIAVGVQWLQARAYSVTGLPVSGAYGEAGPLNIVWAAAVIGLRPAVYGFRQTLLALEEEEGQLHVQAAIGRGLPWRRVVRRYVLRPAAATVVGAWLSSIRLMVGVLPLVEFFFGYPGLGRQLILALGLTYAGDRAPVVPDLAIGLVVTLALLLLTVESIGRLLRLRLDPRLGEEQVRS